MHAGFHRANIWRPFPTNFKTLGDLFNRIIWQVRLMVQNSDQPGKRHVKLWEGYILKSKIACEKSWLEDYIYFQNGFFSGAILNFGVYLHFSTGPFVSGFLNEKAIPFDVLNQISPLVGYFRQRIGRSEPFLHGIRWPVIKTHGWSCRYNILNMPMIRKETPLELLN